MFGTKRDEDSVAAVNDLQALMVAGLLGSVLFGIFTLLFSCSSYILLCNGMRLRSRIILLIATSIMYLLSTTSWAVAIATILQIVYDPVHYAFVPTQVFIAKSTVLSVCLGLNILVADAILLWRTCILWSDNNKVKIISGLLLFIVFVFGLVDFSLGFRSTDTPTDDTTANIPSSYTSKVGLVSLFASLAINIWATALASTKAWQLKKLHDKVGTRLATGGRLLNLLIRCGVAYCIFWTAVVAVAILPYMAVANIILGACASQITGIFPTLVVVLACLQQINIRDDIVNLSWHPLQQNVGTSDIPSPGLPKSRPGSLRGERSTSMSSQVEPEVP